MDRRDPADAEQDPPAVPELRLVLLGRKGAGKSAAGNTILGEKVGFESGKPTEECVKRRAEVFGRRVTVVDTPGWEWYYPLNSTPDWVRRETIRSVSLCPPGPHAVLLVVRSCASVTEAYTSQVEEQLGPLGTEVWDHTVVLFTRGDELGLVPIEQRILTSGPTLQKLLQRCGNRYHVLDNRSKGDGTQVKELMRKMEELVEARRDGGGHLKVDSMVLLGVEADRKRRARERRKKQRQMELQTQRGAIKASLMSDGFQISELDVRLSFSKGSRRLPELRLVLLGERETGKSSAGNTILGNGSFFQSGTVTEECVRRQAEVAMRLVTVVDVPGWEGGVAGPTPERVKREMVGSVSLCPPGPHAVLLTLRVDTLVRVGPVREHLELLGEGVWRHTVLLFTHGDQLREGVGIEQHIQSGGRDLQWLMEKCRGRYHVISNIDGGGGGRGTVSRGGVATQVTELLEMVEKMAAGNRCEAFSGLVQEVVSLSRQKNDRVNQRLKEVGDKMLRQEAELKKMREREVKSIRRFFDRKKKVKSPGKSDVEREDEDDEEERRGSERKNDMGDLEERMKWLTEDRDREIHDLITESDRILAVLRLTTTERDDAIMQLELKERAIEELTERSDEQQLKLLDLERTGLERHNQREAEMTERQLVWRRETDELMERIKQQEREKVELMKTVEALRTDVCESKRRHEDVLSQHEREENRKEQEYERKMVEITQQYKEEMERRLREKDEEIEERKVRHEEEMKRASQEKDSMLEELERQKETEGKLNLEVREMKLKHEKEMGRITAEREKEMKNTKAQHMEEMERKLKEREKSEEERRVRYQEEMERKLREKEDDIEQTKQHHLAEKRDIEQERQRESEELERNHTHKMESKLKEKEREREIIIDNHKKVIEQIMQEKEREMGQLKEQLHEKEQKEKLNLQCKNEMETRLQEKDKEMREMRQQHKRQMEEKWQEQEKEKEQICLNHKAEMEQKLDVKQKEVEELRQHVEKLQNHLRENAQERERIHMKQTMELQEKLEEKVREIRVMEEHHTQQMEARLREGEKEIEKMKESKHEEMKGRLREKEKEIEEMMTQHANEMKAKLSEKEEEGTMICESYRKVTEQKLQEKDREVEEVKLHLTEAERTLQEKDKEIEQVKLHLTEMERTLQEKEKEMEQVKLHLTEMERTLQEKEKEMEEVKLHLTEMERTLQEKEKEVEEVKLHLTELERTLQERDKEMEQVKLCLTEMESTLQEKEKAMEQVKLHLTEMERTLQEKEKEVEEYKLHLTEMGRTLQEKERDVEGKLQKKEAELMEMKLHADNMGAEWKEEQRMKDERKEKEISELTKTIESKIRDVTELQQTIAQQEKEIKETSERCKNYVREIEELKKKRENRSSDITGMEQWHMELARKKDAEMTEILQEKEAEIESLKQKEGDNEKETVQLRQTIEQTKLELSNLTTRMEKEMSNMIQEYEREIGRKEENVKTVAKDLDVALNRLEESERQVSDAAEKCQESQRRVADLCEANDKMRKEIANLEQRHEEREKEFATIRSDVESRETEVRELRCRLEERVKEMELEHQGLLSGRDTEVAALKQSNEALQREVERMRERQNDLREQGDRIEEELMKRESTVKERELAMQRNHEDLRHRSHELETKEEEVAMRERKLESGEEELKKREADLEVKQRAQNELELDLRRQKVDVLNMSTREQNLQRKEKELETWLQVLENKQGELNSYGQDIQTKIKELRAWGKGLDDKEHRLKSGEEELFNWRAELEEQKERVNSKQRQITEMGVELTKLKQELQSREKGLKDTVEELKKWEQRLERDTETYEVKRLMKDLKDAVREWGQSLDGIDTVKRDGESDQESEENEAELGRSDGGGFNGECEVDGGDCNGHGSRNRAQGKTLCNSTVVLNQGPDACVMYQEVGVVEERVQGAERTGCKSDNSCQRTKQREDQTLELALSAIVNNKCQFETWGEKEMRKEDGQHGDVKGRRTKERKLDTRDGIELSGTEVIRGYEAQPQHQSQRAVKDKDMTRSELRLVVLGEMLSPRYSASASVLGVETSHPRRPASAPWRGQIAGRSVSVVEPLGLRWRNGVDPTNTVPKEKIHSSVNLLRSRPHALLLLIPTYLTFTQKYRRAVEYHVGLLGEDIWCRTLVLFTWGEALGESVDQHILRNGDLMWLVEKCGGRYHVLPSKKNKALTDELFEKIEDMVLLN